MKKFYFLSACNLLLTLNVLFAHLTLMQLCTSQNKFHLFKIFYLYITMFLDLKMKAVYIQGL